MKDYLEIIFTHERGQSLLTIDLNTLHSLESCIYESKGSFEKHLNFLWEAAATFRPVEFNGFEIVNYVPDIPKLIKISTCHYTKIFALPEWWGDWDGKFYYIN